MWWKEKSHLIWFFFQFASAKQAINNTLSDQSCKQYEILLWVRIGSWAGLWTCLVHRVLLIGQSELIQTTFFLLSMFSQNEKQLYSVSVVLWWDMICQIEMLSSWKETSGVWNEINLALVNKFLFAGINHLQDTSGTRFHIVSLHDGAVNRKAVAL